MDAGWLQSEVRTLAEGLPEPAATEGRLIDVPVCYGSEYGPDLAGVAAFAGGIGRRRHRAPLRRHLSRVSDRVRAGAAVHGTRRSAAGRFRGGRRRGRSCRRDRWRWRQGRRRSIPATHLVDGILIGRTRRQGQVYSSQATACDAVGVVAGLGRIACVRLQRRSVGDERSDALTGTRHEPTSAVIPQMSSLRDPGHAHHRAGPWPVGTPGRRRSRGRADGRRTRTAGEPARGEPGRRRRAGGYAARTGARGRGRHRLRDRRRASSP